MCSRDIRETEKTVYEKKKLEAKLNNMCLDIQKYQESILELNDWIYLMNLMQSDQYSKVVNEIDKNLKVSDSLSAQNQKLKKEILFQKKLQYDIIMEEKRQSENIDREKQEMEKEDISAISAAKKKMEQTVEVIEKEVEMLRKKNEDIEKTLKMKENFLLYERNMEEIDELLKAKRTINEIFKQDTKK